MAYPRDFSPAIAVPTASETVSSFRSALFAGGAGTSLRTGPARAIQEIAARTLARHTPNEVRLPCMVYAAVGRICLPAHEAEPAIAEMRKAPGVVNVIRFDLDAIDGAWPGQVGIGLVARGYWLARQSLARLLSQLGQANQADEESGYRFGSADADAGMASCTAQFVDGRLRLWHATLDAGRSRVAAARIAGMGVDQIDLRVSGKQVGGSGFSVLVSAIALARELQPAPVQVMVAQELFTQGCALCTQPAAPPVSVATVTAAEPQRPADAGPGADEESSGHQPATVALAA